MFHSQNLGKRHGRAWWHLKNRVLGWEWQIFRYSFPRIVFSKYHFSLGFGPFGSFHFNWNQDHDSNEFRLAAHDRAIWLSLWKEKWGGYDSREKSILKKDFSFHYIDFLFGKRKCTHTIDSEKKEILIPMPEGVYKAFATFETRTWKRPRSPFKLVRKSTDIEIPGGIPFQGKGENSWDCGDDGLWGTGCDGHDLELAIATVVKSVLKSRKRYGKTSKVIEAEKSLVPVNSDQG